MALIALSRRDVLAGVVVCAGFGGAPRVDAATERRTLVLRAEPPGVLAGEGDGTLRFQQGETVAVSVENRLAAPLRLTWRGIACADAEPLLMRPAIAPGGSDSFVLTLPHAGTFMCDGRLGDGAATIVARAVIVSEREPVAVDRDEVLLIADPGDAGKKRFTINGSDDVSGVKIQANDRLRLRFINATQRSVLQIIIADHNIRVMAIDGQPSEPFLARDGLLVLTPGGRIDAFVDAQRPPGAVAAIEVVDGDVRQTLAQLVYDEATSAKPARATAEPLPSNGLPAGLDLAKAVRVGMGVSSDAAGWTTPAAFARDRLAAFQAARGRTVVLALVNRSDAVSIFHLHGHAFRLLDRLDDGWKPFWLDTLAVPPRQTLRIAFAATMPGRWLMETMAAEPGSALGLQCYAVT